MTKREKKIDVINRYLRNCSTWPCSTYGYISEEKFNNACRNYAGNVDFNDAIGMIDTTVFGSGKKGILFTEKGVYYSTAQGGNYFDYVKALEFTGWVEYNCLALNDMITRLKNIEIYDSETAPSGWKLFGDLIGGTIDLLTELSEESNKQSQNNQLQNKNEIKAIESNVNDYVDMDCNNEEEDDALEILECFKGTLKEIMNMLGELIDFKIDNNDEIAEYLFKIVIIAALYSGDKELIESDMIPEEAKQQIYNESASIKENIEFIDSTFSNGIEGVTLEKVSLVKVTRLFAHRIKTVLEDFFEDNDVEEMYESSQSALKDMKNSIRKMTKNINSAIEQLYCE